MRFGDPREGKTDIAPVVDVGSRRLETGCYELSLGDTTAIAQSGLKLRTALLKTRLP